MSTEPLRFLCEQHIGRRVMREIRELPGVEVEQVPNDVHEDDRSIIQYANHNSQTIVTRDGGFPLRRLCSIDRGVLFIPQEIPIGVVRLEDILPCLTQLIQSGRVHSLGHGVCTVLPTGILLRACVKSAEICWVEGRSSKGHLC